MREAVPQLNRQLEAARKRLAAQPLSQRSESPGLGFIPRDHLTFVGYATPEAAFQSILWIYLNRPLDDLLALLPAKPATDILHPMQADLFGESRTNVVHLFLGMQILAKNVLADDRAELKVELDFQAPPGKELGKNPIMIQPMIRVGDKWMPAEAPRAYRRGWEAVDIRLRED